MENQAGNKKPSAEARYRCLRCGYEIQLPDTGRTEIAIQCPNCRRFSIFQKTNIEYHKENYFDSKGKFVAEKLARDVMINHHFITFSDTEEIYYYKNGVYKENGEALVKKLAENILKEEANSYRVSEVLNHIKRATLISRMDIQDSNPHFICVKNGILDLSKIKDGEVKLLPHTSNMIFLTKIPIEYNPDAECPKISRFISQIVKPEDIPTLQEMVGYTMWKKYDIQKAFALVGEGNNGKSTFLNLLVKLLGKKNVASVSLQDLENNRFAIANLYGKYANIYADLPPKALYNTAKFKMLTGSDIITAEKKFRNSFTFYNYAKLIFSCNRLPATSDDTTAFFRRWNIIIFPNKFEGEKADPHILKKIATQEELSGFLNWGLEGLARLLRQGHLSKSTSVEEIRRQYILASDPIHAFVEDCLIPDSEGIIPKELLYAVFTEYCDEKNLPITSKNVFSRDLPKFITVSETRPKIGSRQERCWAGIKLNEYGMQFIPQELIEKYMDIMDKVAIKHEKENDKDNISNLSNFSLILSKENENNNSNKIKKNMDMLDNLATPLLQNGFNESETQIIHDIFTAFHTHPSKKEWCVGEIAIQVHVEPRKVKELIVKLLNSGVSLPFSIEPNETMDCFEIKEGVF